MRKPIIVANWKMYKTRAEAGEFCEELLSLLQSTAAVDVAICAPYTQLDILVDKLSTSEIKVGAQNFYPGSEGAFTGEISLPMLKEIGVRYVLVGHSERRTLFHEDDEIIKQKLEAAFQWGLQPILCVGETLEERTQGRSIAVCQEQLAYAVQNLTFEAISQLIVAYEPVWAIGTGKTATAADAQAVIGALREFIAAQYGSIIAMNVRLQYGGSVKLDNIEELMAEEDIDGVLVGGASLQAESFVRLIAGQENK